MSRRLKYVMFSDAWWDERRSGNHRGRSHPFTARRRYFPLHCSCKGAHWGILGRSLWDAHVVRTVAPK